MFEMEIIMILKFASMFLKYNLSHIFPRDKDKLIHPC